jgi:hypothetical protein
MERQLQSQGAQILKARPKECQRLRALCEAVDFKPPAGLGPEEQEKWWLRVYAMPEEFHDKLWDLFPKHIEAMKQAWAEALAKTRKMIGEWAKTKNATIVRLTDEITRLIKRVPGAAGAEGKHSKEDIALALLVKHPDWSNPMIADAVPCHVKSLPRMKRFKQARKILQEQDKSELPKGSKYRKTDAKQSSIEAWEADENA